jgi:hypothetical protein
MRGIVIDDAKITAVPVPASTNNGINDQGVISGFYTDLATGVADDYVLRKGVRTLIDFPGAVSTLAFDIKQLWPSRRLVCKKG